MKKLATIPFYEILRLSKSLPTPFYVFSVSTQQLNTNSRHEGQAEQVEKDLSKNLVKFSLENEPNFKKVITRIVLAPNCNLERSIVDNFAILNYVMCVLSQSSFLNLETDFNNFSYDLRLLQVRDEFDLRVRKVEGDIKLLRLNLHSTLKSNYILLAATLALSGINLYIYRSNLLNFVQSLALLYQREIRI